MGHRVSLWVRFLLLASVFSIAACTTSTAEQERLERVNQRLDEMERIILSLMDDRHPPHEEDVLEDSLCPQSFLGSQEEEEEHWFKCEMMSPRGFYAGFLEFEAEWIEDIDQKIALLREAAALGEPRARETLLSILDERLQEGNLTPEERLATQQDRANLELFGALRNSKRDSFSLACRYWTGVGVQQDRKRFFYWITQADINGNPGGIVLTFLLFQLGIEGAYLPNFDDEWEIEIALERLEDLRVIRGDGAPENDLHLIAQHPEWIHCLQESPDALAEWWELTGAPEWLPSEEDLQRYREQVAES